MVVEHVKQTVTAAGGQLPHHRRRRREQRTAVVGLAYRLDEGRADLVFRIGELSGRSGTAAADRARSVRIRFTVFECGALLAR